DHCTFSMPQRLQISKGDFSRCSNGLPGAENRMQLLFSSGVMTGRITPGPFVELTSPMPARLFGLLPHKRSLAPRPDAARAIIH
ncbi:dihydropyrimidinase, partial [Escherichia coli]|nr:dihydropyrimidinase [Escherichia coli]